MSDGELDRLLAETAFPFSDTLAEGQFRCREHLRGRDTQRIYLATRTRATGERFFVSVMWAPDAPQARLRGTLGYRAPGVLDMAFLGSFDQLGADPERDRKRRNHCALVEKMPERGEWLPRLAPAPLGPVGAAALGASAGKILARVAKGGVPLVGVRPEYVWAEERRGRLEVTGLTGRNDAFFAHTAGPSLNTGALFERHYCAPEVYADRAEDSRSLVFTLALMVAFWATGDFLFPDSYAGANMYTQCIGQHAPIEVPPRLRVLLEQCLRADPEERPALASMIKQLRKFAR